MTGFRIVLAAGLAAGCHPVSLPTAHPPAAVQLPVTPRGVVAPDVAAVPAGTAPSAPARPAHYRKLTAAECRALAVRNAPLAADLDAHPDNTPPARPHFSRKQPDLSHQSRMVRGYAADEIRNRSAADALELYYKLAAAEGQFDLAAAAHAQLQKELAAAVKVGKAGIQEPVDTDALRRRLLELESQMAKLEAALAVLNAGLAGHLGLAPGDPTPIWPADPLRVAPDAPDAEGAVRTALCYRPDLNLLRYLAAGAQRDGHLANAVLAGVNPLLAAADAGNPFVAWLALLKKEPTKAEARLHQQLVGLLGTRERQADAEVRAAVAMVRGNQLAVAAVAGEVRNLEGKVAAEEQRVKAGVAEAVPALSAARGDLLKARGNLLQAAVDWHISDVRLRQATGLLVRE